MPTLKRLRKSEVSLDCDSGAASASSAASAAKRGRNIPTLKRGPAAAAASPKQEEMPTPKRLQKSSGVPTRPDADDEHDSDGNGDSDGNDEYKDDSSPSSSSSSSSGDDYSESSVDHCDDEDEDEEVRGEKGVANDASKCPLRERKPAAVTTTGSAMRRGGKSEMIDVIDLCSSSDDPAAVEPSNRCKKSIITGKMKDDGGNVIVKDESNNNAAPRSNETNDIEMGKRGNGKKRSGAGDGKRKDNSRNAKEDNSRNAKDVGEDVAKSKTKNGVNFGKGKLGNKNKKSGDVVVRGKSKRGNKEQCDDDDEDEDDGDDVTANDTKLVGTHRVITLRTARDSIRLVAAFVRGLEDGVDSSFVRDFFAPMWSRLKEQGNERDHSRRRRKGGGRNSCRWRIESMAYFPPPSPSRAVYSGEAGGGRLPGQLAGRDYHLSKESVALCVLEDISTLEEVSGPYAIHVHRFATIMPILDRAVTDDIDFGEARRRIIAHDKKKSVDTDDKNRNFVAVSNQPTVRAPVVTDEDSVKSNLSGQCHLFSRGIVRSISVQVLVH